VFFAAGIDKTGRKNIFFKKSGIGFVDTTAKGS
jgi:hypothetical protein